jgi:hypothetical protein
MTISLHQQAIKNWNKFLQDQKLDPSLTYDSLSWIFGENIRTRTAIRHIRKYGYENVTKDKFLFLNSSTNTFIIIKTYLGDSALAEYKEAAALRKKSPYDPLYVSHRDGISYDAAVEHIRKYKKDKATSKEGFIRRHGLQKGQEKFAKFQETSDSGSLDFYIKKYGQEEGENRFNVDRMKSSKRCTAYWLKHGYSEQDAIREVSNHQLTTAGVHRRFYEVRGWSESEIDTIISQIRNKATVSFKRLSYTNLMSVMQIPPDISRYAMRILKNSNAIATELKTKIDGYLDSENKLQFILDNMLDFEIFDQEIFAQDTEKAQYAKLCWFWTNLNDLSSLPNYDKRGFGKEFYNLDHKYSINQGFLNEVHPKIIGSIYNLEFIPMPQNASKRDRCSISLEQLLQEFNNGKNQNS